MSDIDDVILDLVGGDDSDGENSGNDSPGHSLSQSSVPDDSETSLPSSSKAAEVEQSKSEGHDGNSDAEEGEASSAAMSPSSQASAPMDESDSDASSAHDKSAASHPNGDDEDKYPVEGLYKSQREKDDIMSMREIEREKLIADRKEEREKIRQRRLLKQLVGSKGDEVDSTAEKRKASDAELDDSQRKIARQRTKVGGAKVGETTTGIETLKRNRAEKSDRLRRREEDRERNTSQRVSLSRDSHGRDGDDDSHPERSAARSWERQDTKKPSRSRTPEVKKVAFAERHEVERVRVGRSRFAMVCFYPGFEKAITGGFVRVASGHKDGQNQYMMAVIKRFTTGRAYAIEKPNGRKFVTNQHVVVFDGEIEGEFPFIYCSDGKFEEGEFERYKENVRSKGGNLPTQADVAAKTEEIQNLLSRSWKDEEVNEKLNRERELRQKYDPARRNRLINALDDAREAGDQAEVAVLEEKVNALKVPRLAYNTFLDTGKRKQPSPEMMAHDRLVKFIDKRGYNTEGARAERREEKARLLKEEKFFRDQDRMAVKAPLSELARTGTTVAAPTQEVIAAEIAKLRRQASSVDKKGLPQLHRPVTDDDIIGALDFGIDVEIET